MDQLVAKLVNLSYELLGVFLPGLIFSLFLMIFWWCLGDLPTVLSAGGLPTLTLNWLEAIVDKLDVRLGIGVAIPMLVLSYFLGSTLVWISRSGKQDAKSGALHLLRSSLIFKIPKPVDSYAPALKPLLERVSAKFVAPGDPPLEWRMFYPVGKAYLARTISRSLVATYQNKYTFHRSLILSSVFLFWSCTAALLTASITQHWEPVHPYWGRLAFFALFSLFMSHGFTASYRLNWGLFGDTIITELYSLLFGPEVKSSESK